MKIFRQLGHAGYSLIGILILSGLLLASCDSDNSTGGGGSRLSCTGVKVGQLQGHYIAENYQKYRKAGTVNVVMISGSQTDTNALLFSMGAHLVLDPLFANGTLKYLSESFTPDWNNSTAQIEVETALTDKQNNIQIAYVANDGMADSAITALKAVKLNRRGHVN